MSQILGQPLFNDEPLRAVPSKRACAEQLRKDTEAFHLAGGVVTQVAPGISGEKTVFGNPARAKAQKKSRKTIGARKP